LNIQPEHYGLLEYEEEAYHRLFGAFYYCGLVLEGQLVVSEKQFNDIVEPLTLEINTVNGTTIFFRSHDSEQLHNMRLLILQAKCIGDEEAESEFDENFTFHLIG